MLVVLWSIVLVGHVRGFNPPAVIPVHHAPQVQPQTAANRVVLPQTKRYSLPAPGLGPPGASFLPAQEPVWEDPRLAGPTKEDGPLENTAQVATIQAGGDSWSFFTGGVFGAVLGALSVLGARIWRQSSAAPQPDVVELCTAGRSRAFLSDVEPVYSASPALHAAFQGRLVAHFAQAETVKNSAFVFIKPHANTEEARKLVKETLQAKKLTVVTEGQIEGKVIDEKKLIDNHYYAIASKATILSPDELNVPKGKFTEAFGCDWDETLKAGKIFNAMQACEKLGLDASQLDTEWGKAKKADKLVKFGGGFYCGLIDTVEGKEPCYVMNGFFMSMRSNFVAPDASIYYYVVEWDGKDLSWEDFRGAALGPTDPANAPEDSLRGMFYKNWEKYGLAYVPNVGENAVHASASPFEALGEQMNWLGMKATDTAFGQQVLKILDEKTLEEWGRDAQVTYGPVAMKKSVFDSVEDTDADQCLALLGMMYTQQDQKLFSQMTAQMRDELLVAS